MFGSRKIWRITFKIFVDKITPTWRLRLFDLWKSSFRGGLTINGHIKLGRTTVINTRQMTVYQRCGVTWFRTQWRRFGWRKRSITPMLSKLSKPSKSGVIQSLQRTKESDFSIYEPVTQESMRTVSDEISKILRSSGFVSIVVIKHPWKPSKIFV